MLGFRKRERERTIRRILIVEDEPLVAFDNEHLLADAGYEVVATVDSFEAAQAIIDAEALDLVMTDVALAGGGDGLDVGRAAAARGVPVLLVTGRSIDPDACALGCLAKPYSDRALHSAFLVLEDVIGGRKIGKVPAGLILFRTETA